LTLSDQSRKQNRMHNSLAFSCSRFMRYSEIEIVGISPKAVMPVQTVNT
jgi:hypothetical protein